jgi:hypothetical protein
MLSSGVKLSLYIGPLVPIPVGRDVLDALESVQVEVASGDTQSGFELTFRLSRRSPLHTMFLLGGGTTGTGRAGRGRGDARRYHGNPH